MNMTERIERALGDKNLRISPEDFENFALLRISESYTAGTLVPISGGSDWGTDAEIVTAEDNIAVAVTSSRDFQHAKQNLKNSMLSIKGHGLPLRKIIVANLVDHSRSSIEKLKSAAASEGFQLLQVFDRSFFEQELTLQAEWRQKLLGIKGGPFYLSQGTTRVTLHLGHGSLLGREHDLERLATVHNDTIVYGVPGVGKTSLVASIEDVWFLEGSPEDSSLMDNLLDTRPRIVVIDDVSKSLNLLAKLQQIRRQESVLSYLIIVTCWPHQTEQILQHFEDTNAVLQHELELLERQHLAAIIQLHGISNPSLQSYILDQAHGRPGWATMLSRLLVEEKNWLDFISGNALRREISRYLYRSGIENEALELLALIALIGGIPESDFAQLAKVMNGGDTLKLRKLVQLVAVSGLLDVRQISGENGFEQFYSVELERLAVSVVNEVFYSEYLKPAPINTLVELWPNRLENILIMVSKCGLMDNVYAQQQANELYNRAVNILTVELSVETLTSFALLGGAEAGLVITNLETNWGDSLEQYRAEPSWLHDPKLWFGSRTRVLALILKNYPSEQAVHFWLNAILALEEEQLDSNAALEAVMKHTVLDFQSGKLLRDSHQKLWGLSVTWFLKHVKKPLSSLVIVKVFCQLFKAEIDFTVQDSVNPKQVKFGSYPLVAVFDLSQIEEDYWAIFQGFDLRQEIRITEKMISLLEDWSSIASGKLLKFGLGPADVKTQNEALGFVRLLCEWIEPRVQSSPGLRCRLRSALAGTPLELRFVEGDQFLEALFFHDRGFINDFREQESLVKQKIALVISPYFSQKPIELIGRIKELEPEFLLRGGFQQPSLHYVFQIIVEQCENLQEWLEASIQVDWLQGAELLLRRIGPEDLRTQEFQSLLTYSTARTAVLEWLIQDRLERSQFEIVFNGLSEEDMPSLWPLFYSGDFSLELVLTLFEHPNPEICSAFAAAFVAQRNFPGFPAQMRQPWSEAILHWPLTAEANIRSNHRLNLALENIAQYAPDIYCILVRKYLDSFTGEGRWPDFHSFHESIVFLDEEHRLQLWLECANTSFSFLVLQFLSQDSEDFLRRLLSERFAEPALLLRMAEWPNSRLSFDAVARLLKDTDIPAEQIARVAFSGGWVRDQSSHYQSIKISFQTMIDSGDHRFSEIGKAGMRLVTPRLAQAIQTEKRKNIRGEL